MNHRKISHPSNKRCRNFPTNAVYMKKMDTTEKVVDIENNDQYFKCYNEKEKSSI